MDDKKVVELHPGERVMAHSIEYQGKIYPLSIAYMDSDGNISIEPFVAEIHSTPFYNGRVLVKKIVSNRNYPVTHNL